MSYCDDSAREEGYDEGYNTAIEDLTCDYTSKLIEQEKEAEYNLAELKDEHAEELDKLCNKYIAEKELLQDIIRNQNREIADLGDEIYELRMKYERVSRPT